MTAFVIGAVLLLALSQWLLRSVWKGRPPRPANGHAGAASSASAAILGEQLATLERDRALGHLDDAQFRDASDEVRRRVLDEARGLEQTDLASSPARSANSSRLSRMVASVAVPVFAIALYAAIGEPSAVVSKPGSPGQAAQGSAQDSAQGSTNQPEVTPEALQTMLASLEQRLQTPSGNPASDSTGWSMLARSYAGLGDFAKADDAFAHAIELTPGDAQLLADRADVLAILQGQRTDGEPDRLIREALKIDPRNLKALALAGTSAYRNNDLPTARGYWQRAREIADPRSEFAAGLDRSIAEINASSGERSAQASAAVDGQAKAARIAGRVSLAPGFASKVKPTDTVFVFARAATGPRMPLAVVRKTVADLPFDFVLDDAMAMSPQARLSSTDRVIVSARVSRSGDPMPAPGDLQAESLPMASRAADVQLLLDSVTP